MENLRTRTPQARATEFNIPQVYTVEELLADPEIEIVVNITIPKAHFSVAMAAIQAGKSVWNEKPLTITRDEVDEALTLLSEAWPRIG